MTIALREVAALVYEETGIRLAERQFGFLEASLARMGSASAPEAFLRRASDPLQRTELVTRLIEEVTVKETSFLRDRRQLESIDWRLLLEDARSAGADYVRVWTAACATGEEPYSLALLAHEVFAPVQPPVRILATDISGDATARASLGVYRSRSVRELDAGQRKRYFRQEGDQLVVREQLRSIVSFAQHNLIRDPFPPLGETPFDLILCRNVLIYFDAETVARVLQSFERALGRSGELMLGAADVLCASASRLAGEPGPDARASRRASRTERPLRRPLGRLPAVARIDEHALMEEESEADAVLTETARLLAADPLNADAHFRRGLAQLEAGDPIAAVESLRRALYVEPHFGLAAFKLGGAHEALGDAVAARRAYERALRALEPHERHESVLGQIEIADVATAAQARLDVLAATGG